MSVKLSCDPCIDRTFYTLRAILHGTSNDDYWQKLAASARQSAQDMRVNLELELYPPGGYSEGKMASDIRAAADSGSDSVDALVVTIPTQDVADAVRYAAGKGMPIFGLNSGFEEVSGGGGLVEDGSVLFFTAMNERLGGAKAADYFLQRFATGAQNNDATNVNMNGSDTTANTKAENIDDVGTLGNVNRTTNITIAAVYGKYTNALFISPLGEKNSAFQQRFDGYHDRLVAASNDTDFPINVEWFELDSTSKESIEQGLSEKLSQCKYQSVLVGSGRFAPDVETAISANGCHRLVVPTKMGTFDTSASIFDLIAMQRMEFAIDQYNHMQGWAPVHLAALYVSTGFVLAPPPDGVYLSGPALFTQKNSITDTLRICTDDAFPVCPTRNGPDGLPSDCPCTDRKKIIIGGVVHGITTDGFWDTVFAAAEQGAEDMRIDLQFDRFEPQQSNEILHRKMSAKILSLCQGGVDGLFVTISSEVIVEAVKKCLELDIPVMSINAGFAESKELKLIHHVGMVEENAGFQAGKKMASMATFKKAFCLNHFPENAVTVDRCIGFGKALNELDIEYMGQVDLPDDNIARFRAIVEKEVDEPGDWDDLGFLLAGASAVPAALELKELHSNAAIASFDTSTLLYEAIYNGDVLFGVDQQAYLQGYLPIPVLTHAAATKQTFLNHAIESGPSFVLSSPNTAEAACEAGAFAVCPEHPQENFNYVNDGLIILGVIFFAVQAVASLGFLSWMTYFRNANVVKASQPEFLSLVAIGCLMLASSILPLSIEGGYRFERNAITLDETDVPNEEIHTVDAACMAVPWLICTGFVLIYSALLAKLNRINEIVQNAQRFRRVEVPRKKVAITIACLMTVMVAILLTWQLVSPLKWDRDVTGIDFLTGYPTESIGRCTSEHFAAFAGSCAFFIGLCLAYGLRLCYKTRHLPVEFFESQYIAASVFYLLQLLMLGVPILVIASENTNAYFMVMAMIIFLMSFGTSLLIFVPKIIAHKKGSGIMTNLMVSAAQTQTVQSSNDNTVEAIRRRVASVAVTEVDSDLGRIGESMAQDSNEEEDLSK